MFLITATRNLLNSSIEYGLPLRGAISAGYLFINPFEIKSQYMTFENVIFGDSMVKAFNLEKNQIWSGCIIDPQLEDSEDQGIKSFLSSGDMGKFYCRYDVPIRNNGCESLLALNWRNMDNDRFSEEIIRNSFSSFNKGTEQKDIQNKIDNTISFYNHLKNLRVINSAD
jgi:hypothetical protein